MRPARTETYEHTISGLLAKRVEMFHEAERIRDRLAEIRNDVAALDRVLHTLGYSGNLDADLAQKLGAIGIQETERNLANKISRGGFTGAFLLQCLVAIGCTTLRLAEP